MSQDELSVAEAEEIIEAIIFVTQDPGRLLAEVFKYCFHGGLYPKQDDTLGELPELPKYIELLPLDLLGKYEPRRLHVTIYVDRVKQVAERLGEPCLHLKQVVMIHEWAHAMVHIGQAPDASGAFQANERARRRAADRLWYGISSDLHEQLAQLLTYHALVRARDKSEKFRDHAERLIRAFEALCSVQPAAYRIDHFVKIPVERVATVFDMLKRGQLLSTGFVRALHL